MERVPGGAFWVGSERTAGAAEETPRFRTALPDFCMDRTEVTVRAYAACVAAGRCSPAESKSRFCNVNFPDRGDHPINCVTWSQAAAYCAAQAARLPTEVEWEYVARAGAEQRPYPWGKDAPDGRTCWKHIGGSCRVGEFAAGAYGLFDVVGNVWEWTATPYGPYPWPPQESETRVYRGGSWSRRFEKWLSPTLRNRQRPDEWGSHLGFRCATGFAPASCPFGARENGECRFGIEDVVCPTGTQWNGARCAKAGEPQCREGRRFVAERGCVLEGASDGAHPEGGPSTMHQVVRARAPEFDDDCQRNKPGRPQSYRYTGGTHHERNRVSRAAGCANRDVGVGWNSTCCP
jgi:hypothetical protein